MLIKCCAWVDWLIQIFWHLTTVMKNKEGLHVTNMSSLHLWSTQFESKLHWLHRFSVSSFFPSKWFQDKFLKLGHSFFLYFVVHHNQSINNSNPVTLFGNKYPPQLIKYQKMSKIQPRNYFCIKYSSKTDTILLAQLMRVEAKATGMILRIQALCGVTLRCWASGSRTKIHFPVSSTSNHAHSSLLSSVNKSALSLHYVLGSPVICLFS